MDHRKGCARKLVLSGLTLLLALAGGWLLLNSWGKKRLATADATIGPCILLEVSDAGPGIPPDLRDRLFDAFVTGREGGTGLGLSVVQRAVEAHRGLVFVDSEVGQGTKFSLFLPKTKEKEVGRE